MADRRAAVTKGVEAGLSVRRSCSLVGLERKTFRYRSRRPRREELRARLRLLAEERVRWGYRRLHVLLRREGIQANHKAVYRLYREEGLAVRRRSLGNRTPSEFAAAFSIQTRLQGLAS